MSKDTNKNINNDKIDMAKYNLNKEYLNFLKLEIDETFNPLKRLELINQYISNSKNLLNYATPADRREIILELIRLYHLKLDLLENQDEKSKTFAEVRKLILPELEK